MAVVLLCFAAGVVLRRAWPRSEPLAAGLDRIVLTVALPALILLKLPDLPFDADAAVPVAVAWAALLVAAAVVLVTSKVAGWDRRTVGTLLLVTPLANTSFLGIAAVRAILGEDRLAPALAYDQLGTFLGLVTYGSIVAGRYGHRAEVPVSVVRRLLVFPPFLALLASIPLRLVDLPGPAVDVLDLLADLVAPLAVLALGLRFRLRTDRDVLGPALACLSTRMVLVPALALLAFHLGPGGRAWEAAVLQSGMPPMVTAGVVATAAGLDERLATFVVGVGLALAFVSLPLLGALL